MNISGRVFAAQFNGNGGPLVDLNATNISSGTLADARLTTNVAKLSAAQTFTNVNTFALPPSFTNGGGPFLVSSNLVVANLNADLLDGMDSTAYLTSLPNPMFLSGSPLSSAIINGQNTSSSAGSKGLLGNASAATGDVYGVEGIANSTSGSGVFGFGQSLVGTNYGVRGFSNSPDGYGVAGLANDLGGVGTGVLGTSLRGIGVQGTASGTGAFTTYGLYGQSFANNGRAVFGHATNTGAANTPYGVRGEASTATLGFGVYALGDLGGSGVKPFRIDHPSDPENKYLLHYSSESPFPQNFYNGNVTTDQSGYAWVELPDYFDSINTNFKYVLTIVDEGNSENFVQAKVSKKLAGNRFQVRTNAPNVEVSWMVFADRNDERIKFHRPTDVREKGEGERGKYQHPEYYGMPKERSMNYIPERQYYRKAGK